jgi:hypothetical protein
MLIINLNGSRQCDIDMLPYLSRERCWCFGPLVEASTPCLTIPFGTFPSVRLLPEFEATTQIQVLRQLLHCTAYCVVGRHAHACSTAAHGAPD